MERGYVQAVLIISIFFLFLPGLPAPTTIPIDAFCNTDADCANQCIDTSTYNEYVCNQGYCHQSTNVQACPSGTTCQGSSCVSNAQPPQPPQCNMNELLCSPNPETQPQLTYCEGLAYMSCSNVRAVRQDPFVKIRASVAILLRAGIKHGMFFGVV